MAFCTGCGADVTGKNFCMSCGKPVGSGQPAAGPPQPPQPPGPSAAPPPAYAPPPQAAYAPPPQAAYGAAPQAGPPVQPAKRKVHPLVWVLVGFLGLCLIGVIAVTLFVRSVVHHVKQNPAMAMAKLLTAGNPNIEVVSADEGRNTVTFRDKQTGETITMNFDDIKNGRIDFKGPKGERASINARGSGQNGSLEINGPNGSMQFGAGANAKIPDWVPIYPGATPTGNFSMQSGDGSGGTLSFSTKDAPDAVLAFYNRSVTGAGFKITGTVNGTGGGAAGNMITAEDEGTKRTLVITLGSQNGETAVNIIYGTKK